MSTLWQARNPSPHPELVQRSATPRALNLATRVCASSATAPSDILLDARRTRTIPGRCPFHPASQEGAPRLPNQRRSIRPLLSDDALRCARDWQFLFDLGTGCSIFPIDIAVTRQRPDIVIFSQSLRIVNLIELRVPVEDRSSAGCTRKTDRYSALLATCENNGWHATHFPVWKLGLEVGQRTPYSPACKI